MTADLRARIEAAIEAGEIWNLHCAVVLSHGETLAEHYGRGEDMKWGDRLGVVTFTRDTLHDLRSVTKSLVGLLYGIALERGLVPAPAEPLYASFPDYPDLASLPGRDRITIEHVLTMTMGMEWDESLPYTSTANSEVAMEFAPDRFRYILERPIVGEPGIRWGYNGGASALLGALIERGSGLSLPDFAGRSLFDPLGVGAFEWTRGRDGTPSAASGLRLRAVDLARIGQLVVQGGTWDATQVVPAAWLGAALRPRVEIEGGRSYGYQWYTGEVEEGALRGSRWVGGLGNGGQTLWIVPEHELVVVGLFGNYDRPDSAVPRVRLLELVAPGG